MTDQFYQQEIRPPVLPAGHHFGGVEVCAAAEAGVPTDIDLLRQPLPHFVLEPPDRAFAELDAV